MNPLLIPAALALLAPGCHVTVSSDPNRVGFIQVQTTSATGSEAEPMAFTSTGGDFDISVQLLDRDGKTLAQDAGMSVTARPGSIDGEGTIDLVDGKWSGTVTVKNGFGPTHIWVNDDMAGYQGRSPSWVTGVSDTLWFQYPTISEVQATSDHETNNLDREFAQLRLEDRQVVLTAVATDGFWAADITDGNGNYNGIYVYTFNRPDYELTEGESELAVNVGDRLAELTGIDQEYLATTQLSFPTYAPAPGETLTVPDPVEITAALGCDDDEMEKLESLPVRISNALIPADFTDQASTEDYEDYVAYGQWPIDLGECTLYAENTTTVPDFFPTEHSGETLEYVQGMLSEVYGKWILKVRDSADISYTARSPAPPSPRATGMRRNLPRKP